MAWEVEYTDEFETWWNGLDEEEQIEMDAIVGLLEEKGPHLPYPYSSDIKGTKYAAIRELRIQYKGKPYRILYAFDPRREPFCSLGEGRQGENAGTINMCHGPKKFTRSI
jgi:hypothetical protein